MSATWQWVKANPYLAARYIRELERQNTILLMDENRLDWLDNNAIPWRWLYQDRVNKFRPVVITWKSLESNRTLRDAIDAARKEAQQSVTK